MPGQKETSERTWSDSVILPKRKLRLGEVSAADRLMKPLREQVTTSWGPRIPSILWGLSSHYGLNCEFILYMMSPLHSDNPLRTTSPFLLVLADPVPLTEPVLGKYKWMNESICQWADQCISEWMNAVAVPFMSRIVYKTGKERVLHDREDVRVNELSGSGPSTSLKVKVIQ